MNCSTSILFQLLDLLVVKVLLNKKPDYSFFSWKFSICQFTWRTDHCRLLFILNNNDPIFKISSDRMLTKTENVNHQQDKIDQNVGSNFVYSHLK